MKNFIANIPLYVGHYIGKFAGLISGFGLYLHIKFKTPTGDKALKARKFVDKFINMYTNEQMPKEDIKRITNNIKTSAKNVHIIGVGDE